VTEKAKFLCDMDKADQKQDKLTAKLTDVNIKTLFIT
jgi:hypothetical protein